MKWVISLLVCLSFAGIGTALVFWNKFKHATRPVHSLVIDRDKLQKKLMDPPPEWMVRQVRKDCAPYREKGIAKADIDQAFCGSKIEQFNLVRFTIEKGHLTVSHDEKNWNSRHFRELWTCIRKLKEQIVLPDVDFIVSLEDGFGDNPGLGPCLVFAKKEGVEGLILIPDINALAGYERLREMIPKANQQIPWEKKRAKSFWRGSSTGGYSTFASWPKLARAKLVLLSIAHPDLIDARFHQVVQSEPGLADLLKEKGMVSSSVSRADHLRYKYLVDVDGNSCSYERYFWLLLSNSLVLKQMTPNVQWYYGGLEPYCHFVPVKEDLSDLLEKIEWAKGHDKEAKAMAERASAFVEENLSPEDTLVYLFLVLQELSSLQRKNFPNEKGRESETFLLKSA